MVTHAATNRAGAEETAALIRADGGAAATWIGDLTDPDGAWALVGTAVETFGGLHILVNNAAIRGNDALGEMSLETFQAIMRTNVEAPMLCAQAAPRRQGRRRLGPDRLESRRTLSAHRGVTGRVHVAASEMALVGMTLGARRRTRR